MRKASGSHRYTTRETVETRTRTRTVSPVKRRRQARKFMIESTLVIILFVALTITGIVAIANQNAKANNDTGEEASIVFEAPQTEQVPPSTDNQRWYFQSEAPEEDNLVFGVATVLSPETNAVQLPINSQVENAAAELAPQEEITTEQTATSTGIVCLTFDDGPSTNITPQILDTLKEKGVKATFFILDFEIGSEKEALIRRAIDEGHTIGIHGMSHEYSTVYSSSGAAVNNFAVLQQKLLDVFGYEAKYIRYPGGSSNTVSKKYSIGVVSESAEILTDLGFVYFDWNVDSDDAGSAKTSDEIYQNVVSTVYPNRTNVVLMHDASTKQETAKALGRIIDSLLESGYEIKPIDESITPVQHPISN